MNYLTEFCSPIKTIGVQIHRLRTPIETIYELCYFSNIIKPILIDFITVLWYNKYNFDAVYCFNRRLFQLKILPSLFIISCLCSISEWAYLFSVTVAFLCPNISAKVFTSIPHSKARVANVCRSE